jgi:hypothetical protein
MVWPNVDGIERKQERIVPVHIPIDKVNDIADLLTDKSPIADFDLPNDITLRLYSKLMFLY